MQELSYISVASVAALPDPIAGLAGVTVRLTTDNKPYWCTGSAWVDLTAASNSIPSRIGSWPGTTSSPQTGALRYYPQAACTVTGLKAWAGAAVPSDTTVTLKKNGASIAAATIASGQVESSVSSVSVSLAVSDYLTMDISAAGAADVCGRVDF